MRKLSRTKLGQISDAWDAGTLGAHTSPQNAPKRVSILAKNTTSGTLKTGSNIQITGFSGTLTYAQARQKMLNGNLVLTIGAATSSASTESLATTTQTIPAGGIGTIQTDVVFSEISISSSSDVYATAAGASTSTQSSAAFRILAKSGTNTAGAAICCLAKLGGGTPSLNTVALSSSSVYIDSDGYLTISTHTYYVYAPNAN